MQRERTLRELKEFFLLLKSWTDTKNSGCLMFTNLHMTNCRKRFIIIVMHSQCVSVIKISFCYTVYRILASYAAHCFSTYQVILYNLYSITFEESLTSIGKLSMFILIGQLSGISLTMFWVLEMLPQKNWLFYLSFLCNGRGYRQVEHSCPISLSFISGCTLSLPMLSLIRGQRN